MRKFYLIWTLAVLISGCVAPLTPLQRRGIESRELEGTFEDAFKATLQVFQDYGYVIRSSDYHSGVIQGETGIKKNFIGLMTNQEITATLEQYGEGRVKERLSLVKKYKSSSQYGTQEDSELVEDPEFFQKIYDDIQKEMFIRKNLAK
ncbi:MAG: hypothetical protein FJZ09_05945 [Candidatus Omnitrophica bacterium]|nr:hypothetical protein [Candidatus Omnitrophota bacterium]